MANANLDIINNAFADMRGTEFITFKQANRLSEALDAEAMVTVEDGGTYIERIIMTNAPNTGVAVVEGDEDSPTANKQVTKKVRVEPVFYGAYVYIPEAHLARAKNKKLALDLIKSNTMTMQEAINQDFDSRIAVGTGSGKNGIKEVGLQALTSMFGPATGRTDVLGVEDGVLEFALPSAQTNKFHNLDRDEDLGIYTQYQHEGAWDYSVWCDFVRLCAEFAPDENNPKMLIVFSPGVYRKYEAQKEGKLQITMVGDKIDANAHFEDTIAGQRVVYNNRMRETKAALAGTAAVQGLTYCLCLPTWEWVFFQKPEWSEFKEHGGTQFSVRQKYTSMHGLICFGPPANGAITGGA